MDIITSDNVAMPIENTDEVKALKAMVQMLSGKTIEAEADIDLMSKMGLIDDTKTAELKLALPEPKEDPIVEDGKEG